MDMNDRINQLIPIAIDAIRIKIANGGSSIPKEYKGYINALGPSILQAGLIATLAFCTDRKKSIENTDRNNVLNALLFMLPPKAEREMHLLKYVMTECLKQDGQSYEQREKLATVDLDQKKLEAMEETILEMVIALKLALKTFKLADKTENSDQ